jgi:hypothetical protein
VSLQAEATRLVLAVPLIPSCTPHSFATAAYTCCAAHRANRAQRVKALQALLDAGAANTSPRAVADAGMPEAADYLMRGWW